MKDKDKATIFLELAHDIELFWKSRGGTIGDMLDDDLSVTAQPYMSLVIDTSRLSRNDALIQSLDLLRDYANGKKGALYWRKAPTIARVRGGRKWAFRVEMTLLISDNPVVPRLQASGQRPPIWI